MQSYPRIDKLRNHLSKTNIDAIIVTNPLNVRYLSGYTGSSGRLVISEDDLYIISDSRYELQCAVESPHFKLALMSSQWEASAVEIIHRLKPSTVSFEADSITFEEWNHLSQALTDIQLIPADNYISSMRLIKDEDEISLMRKAVNIADMAFSNILNFLSNDITEKELTAEIDCELRRCGADRESFDTITISGIRTAFIHGQATDKRIQTGDLVLMDFGARYQGYNSDITRTVVIGEPTKEQIDIYDIVLQAQMLAIEAIKPGVSGCDIDAIARNFISDKGYGDFFGHGLGHGLGLHIHDSQAFSKFSALILEPGIIATVEPGIYIPNWGGIRIEDNILVTESGYEILTQSPKSTLKSINPHSK